MTEYPLAAHQAPETTVTLAEPGAHTGLVRRTVLAGGLRVITESLPRACAAASISVDSGTRDEDPAHAGIAHFLEHLLFQGGHRRTSAELEQALAMVGARRHGRTSQEWTSYDAHLRAEHLPVALDVLGDIVTRPALEPAAVEVERTVIEQEIHQRRGTPHRHAGEAAMQALFPGPGLGASIGGDVATIRSLPREAIVAWHRATYTPDRLVVAAAGGVDHDRVVEQARALIADVPGADPGAAPAPPRRCARPATASGTAVDTRDIAQAHLALGIESLAHDDPRLPAMELLTAALGQGRTSRLTRLIRQERGLAYTVRATAVEYSGTGMCTLYAGCAPDRAEEVVALMRHELARVAAQGITGQELELARAHLLGEAVLAGEELPRRRDALRDAELRGHHTGLCGQLAAIEALTLTDVAQVAGDVLSRPHVVAALGPFDPDRVL